ncbi:hypothetical protein QUB07_06220 [Microcoleus sp. F8-C5]
MDFVERVKLFSTKIAASGTDLDFHLGFHRLRLRPKRSSFWTAVQSGIQEAVRFWGGCKAWLR